MAFVRNAGLLRREHIGRVSEAYALYRTRDEGADSENARFFRGKYSQEIEIHFLGVWDTVGALGVPVESFDWFNKSYYQFHDTELSGIVKNAFHAIAIDEHRRNYQCTLWDPKGKPNQRIEQTWFSGAHANIGSGYSSDLLSDLSPLDDGKGARLRDCIGSAKSSGSASKPSPDYGFLQGLPEWLV